MLDLLQKIKMQRSDFTLPVRQGLCVDIYRITYRKSSEANVTVSQKKNNNITKSMNAVNIAPETSPHHVYTRIKIVLIKEKLHSVSNSYIIITSERAEGK